MSLFHYSLYFYFILFYTLVQTIIVKVNSLNPLQVYIHNGDKYSACPNKRGGTVEPPGAGNPKTPKRFGDCVVHSQGAEKNLKMQTGWKTLCRLAPRYKVL